MCAAEQPLSKRCGRTMKDFFKVRVKELMFGVF